uniref:Uncharacterized protein n=1 Tax=Vespula pensylvanica TaxID=30213 RepID=A0A834NXA7_VESPE|nr:hypothetical protein H0235_010466 [Vespula pensylvanica]
MKSVVSYRRQSVHGLRETRNGGDATGNGGGGGISDGDVELFDHSVSPSFRKHSEILNRVANNAISESTRSPRLKQEPERWTKIQKTDYREGCIINGGGLGVDCWLKSRFKPVAPFVIAELRSPSVHPLVPLIQVPERYVQATGFCRGEKERIRTFRSLERCFGRSPKRRYGVVDSQKRGGLRSTSHLGNNASDNGQRASGVSLKHALNSREPTNWLKRRELGLGRSIPPPPPSPPPSLPLTTTTPSSSFSLLLPPR